VRGEEITVGAIWDDTDIVHVLTSEILVRNFHTNTYQRLQSSPTASLVVKLSGATAGFTAEGFGLDIDDRIGGTVQVIGQPGFPVILTDLRDDTVGAGFDLTGLPTTDTNEDDGDNNRTNGQGAAPVAGSWRSIRFERLSNDRNVAVYNEREATVKGASLDRNATPGSAENLGVLAPNVVNRLNNPLNPGAGVSSLTDLEREAIREKGGDDNRRLGFEVHGFLQGDAPTDIDVYQFSAYTQSEVWIDIDKTSSALDTEIAILRADGTVIASSADSQAEGAASGARLPLTRDAWRGGDFWGTNPKDAGLRVILPGTIPNQLDTYYVRVRSTGGATTGKYQLQIRVNQRDEVPGSTVQFADVRYAQSGVEIIGLPRQSPLVGDTNEVATDNNGRGGAQELGNLLQTDRNSLSVGGFLTGTGDVDWYAFTVDFDLIQVIGGSSNGTKTWSTIFDIDYADGFSRPDSTMSIFDSNGRLILTSRDSDVQDDQPGQTGSDIDDLTRGSAGKLDPYIGPVTLPAGNPNGAFTSNRGTGAPPNVRPAGHPQRYYVAISHDQFLPRAMNAFFTPGTGTSTQVRLEPVNSLRRPVEDHIGFDGYSSQGSILAPETPALIDTSTAQSLNTHITPFGLGDVTLFVSTSGSLQTFDAVTGDQETLISTGYGGLSLGDLDMRPDGKLYAYAGVNNNGGTVGRLIELNSGTGGQTNTSDDGIPNRAATNPTNNQTNSNSVSALAFQRSGVGDYDNLWYIVDDGGESKLYRAADGGSAAGNANGAANQAHTDTNFGYFGRLLMNMGNLRPLVTGLQFVQDSGGTMLGVTNDGRFISITPGGKVQGTGQELIDFNSLGTQRADFTAQLGALGATGFAGLAAAPQNLQDGRFRGMFFAITNTGELCVINPTTNSLVNVAEWGGNFSPVLTNNPTGLAFSPVDFNLWHATERRGRDAGHGINATFDNTRTPSAEGRVVNVTGDLREQTEAIGGASLYFGLEQYTDDPEAAERYFRRRPSLVSGFDNGQYGVVGTRTGVPTASYTWQEEITANPAHRDNYNAPGGAFGSLTTNSFSLGGYARTDRPVLYFNYWLQTQNANAKDAGMRDAARVFVSQDNGVTWEMLATNNSALSAAMDADGELPAFASHTADRFGKTNQRVQQLYETSEWRQARVDLGEYAGQANLRLRFDFTTAGEMDPTNPLNNFADTTFGNFNHPERGQNNAFEGFYIDDIIVGFAERGEMVTGAQNGDDTFVAVPTDPDPMSTQTSQIPSGAYQLYIRRGTEFGFQPIPSQLPDVAIGRRFDTNDRFVEFPAPAAGALVTENFETAAVPGGDFSLGLGSNGRIQLADEIDTEVFVPGGGLGGGEHADHPEDHIVAIEGQRALFLDAPVSGTATTNKIVWNPNLNLATGTPAFLSFQYITLEPNAPLQNTFTTLTALGTGVAISGDDGDNWVRVFTPGNTQGEWREGRIDLATIARNMGIALGPNFRVGFFQRGSARWEDELPDQGFFDDFSGRLGIDNIQVLPTASIGSTQSIGDRNTLREQGQIVIANNIVRFSQNIGIDAVAAPRDPGTNLARPGSAVFHTDSDDNTPFTPYSRLAPGVVINNNLITEGNIGIRFGGDTNTDPVNVVPYGRIVNNTIVSAVTGIQVLNNAGPTLLNNLLSGAATSGRSGMTTGISVDASSAPNTVVGTSFYHGVNTAITGVADSNSITRALSDPMFVNALAGNFYLAQGSRAIDASLNSLQDRPNNVSVIQPLLIPESPILAPDFDLFGQLRQDDGSQGNVTGLGQTAFKDRGAIERADFTNPSFRFVELATTDTTPGFETRLDSITAWGGDPRLDRDDLVDSLSIQDKTAAQVTEFRFRLADIGVGIDKSTVVSQAFQIQRTNLIGNVTTLVAGTDYTFIYNENTNEVKFVAPATWKPGTYQIVVTSRPTTPTQAGFLTDLANNTLLANKSNGTISFDIALKLEDPTVNQPANVTIFEDQGTADTDNGNGSGHVPVTLGMGDPAVTDTSVLLVPVTGITPGGKLDNAPGAPGYNNLENQPIRVTAVSSDPAVLVLAQLTYPSPVIDPTRAVLQIAPIPNLPLSAPVTVTITVTVTDAGFDGVFNAATDPEFDDQTVTTTFTVTIKPRNDLPTQDTVAAVTYNGIIPADRRLNITGITAGGDESQELRVTASSGDLTILAPPTVVYTSPNNTAELQFNPGLGTPAFGVAGTVPVTVTVRDAGFDGMFDTPDDGVRVQVFNVTFAPNNTLPTIDPVNPINHTGWVGPQTVNLTNISTGAGDLQALRAQMTFSAPPNFFVNTPTLIYTPNNTSGIVTYTPRGDVTGTATITVRIFDDGVDLVAGNADDGFIERTFDINVVAYNDPPVANNDAVPVGSNAAPLEDNVVTMPISQLLGNDQVATSAPYLTTETQTPPGQGLTLVSVQNAVGGTVAIVGGNVVFTPNADFNGTATFQYTVRDNGLNNGLNDFKTATATVSITYTAVNDAPRRITGPANTTINVRQDQFQVPLGFSNLAYTPGPADEAGQTLTYQVTQLPAGTLGTVTLADGRTPVGVGSSLTLSQLQGLQFRPNGLTFGQGTFQLRVRDNGGTLNGGLDTLLESFTINVTPLDPANLQKVRFIRSFNPNADYHFFTTSTPEFNNALTAGYQDETTNQAGFALSFNPIPGGVAISRLYNVQTGRHYYTTSTGERDFLANLIPVNHPEFGKVGWRYELDEPFVYPVQVPGTTEIFRLYNNNSGVHLYTESVAQKDAILAAFPGIWVQHSSLGFAFIDPARSFIPNGPFFATAASSSAPAVSASATAVTSSTGTTNEAVETTDRLVRTVGEVPGSASRSAAPVSAPATSSDTPSTPVSSGEPEASAIDMFWSSLGGTLSGGTDVALDDFE
jgi:hypothetical protein